MNFFYKWLMDSKANGLHFKLEGMIDIINEYNLVNGPETNESQILEFTENEKYFIFKKVNGDKTSYNIFYVWYMYGEASLHFQTYDQVFVTRYFLVL